MNWYKARLQLRGSLTTPLIGDTIFGHVCWGIVRTKGEEALQTFLKACENDPSYFSVSNAFPEGMLPKPILPAHTEAEDPTPRQYARKKKNKKRRFIPANFLLQQKEPLSRERLNSILEETKEELIFKTSAHLHNTINRLTGTTEGPTGLYTSEEISLSTLLDLDEPGKTMHIRPLRAEVYIVSREGLDVVEPLLKGAFQFGYGADASTGKGWIEVEELTKIEIPTEGNRYMALGPFIPSNEERTQISKFTYEVFIRRGKLGPEFVHQLNPFKKPIILFSEGSSFLLNQPKQVIGTVLRGVHPEGFIRHAAHTPILPFLAEE